MGMGCKMRVIFGNNVERVVLEDGVLRTQYKAFGEWVNDFPIMGAARNTILFLIECLEDQDRIIKEGGLKYE